MLVVRHIVFCTAKLFAGICVARWYC